jgi:hypothetical protein
MIRVDPDDFAQCSGGFNVAVEIGEHGGKVVVADRRLRIDRDDGLKYGDRLLRLSRTGQRNRQPVERIG